MKYPRLSLFVLNAIGLFCFAVAATALNPSHTGPAVGYGVAFLMMLAVVLPAHLFMGTRWNGATTAVVSFLAFCAFTALGDNVAVGVAAAIQLAVTLGCVPDKKPAKRSTGWRGVQAVAPEGFYPRDHAFVRKPWDN